MSKNRSVEKQATWLAGLIAYKYVGCITYHPGASGASRSPLFWDGQLQVHHVVAAAFA